jgi:nucleoside-diphosphate-sugar epimerase
LTDPAQTLEAVSGSTVVYLLAGLKYDAAIWGDEWPRIMHNAIESCKRAHAKLIFFDNVYMYGKVGGRLTEETPFNPCSRKGDVRARIATTLMEEMKSGNLTALIARSADFYGSRVRTGIPNVLVFDPLLKGEKASWLVDDSVRHSFTYTPDAARSLIRLADAEHAWNQTWHVPTASDPPAGKEFIRTAAEALKAKPGYRVLNRPMLKIAGFFSPDIRELYEMLYQYDAEYLFDSSKYSKAFGHESTPYAEGIRHTVAAYGIKS